MILPSQRGLVGISNFVLKIIWTVQIEERRVSSTHITQYIPLTPQKQSIEAEDKDTSIETKQVRYGSPPTSLKYDSNVQLCHIVLRDDCIERGKKYVVVRTNMGVCMGG